MKFTELDIPKRVLQGIADASFHACTPVQAATLPQALRGEDVAAQAQTGTGKTAAFLIAIFSRMLRTPAEPQPPDAPPCPRALIIAPTRELVVQIKHDADILGRHTGFRIEPIFGGMDYLKQREILRQGADIVVGTPGRLIDYLKQKVYTLKRTRYLVIDEADRMFDMGFIADLRYMLRRLPSYDQRQSFLFSATLSHRVMELCYEHMNLTEKVSLTPEKLTVDKVVQELYHVGRSEKNGTLLGLIRREAPERTLIFVNTKAGAERVVALLEANGYKASALTGDRTQQARIGMLRKFKEGELPFLVATDVASRGLHIDGVTHVFNYDLPQDREDYVHRIGRTARAGATGKAITLACEEYVYSLYDIEDYIKQQIPVMPIEDGLIVKDYKRGKPHRRTDEDLPPRREGGREGGRTGRGPGRGSRPQGPSRSSDRSSGKPAQSHAHKPTEVPQHPAPEGEAATKKRRRRRKPRPPGEGSTPSAT